MEKRLALQAKLEELLGSRNVYYQPPSNIQLKYPCIVYERDSIQTHHADNLPYHRRNRYSVTLIDKNPDSPAFEKLAELPLSAFSRHFVVDNLNHDTFTLYEQGES